MFIKTIKKMKKQLGKTVIVFLLIPLFFFSGCKETAEKEDNNGKENVKIGLIADLTGPMALYGNWVKKGAEISMNNINQNDTNNLELIIEDSESQPKSAVNAINKLTSIKDLNFIITGNGSSAVMSMAPIANKNKSILFVALASSPTITNAGEYVFRNRISGHFEAKKLTKFSLEKEKIDRPAIIALNNESGKPYIKSFEEGVSKHEENLEAKALVSPDKSNLRTEILKFKKKNVDGVYLVLQANQAIDFITQSIEMNYNPKWFGVSSLKSDKIIDLPEKVTSQFYIASEAVQSSNPEYEAFNKKYKQKYDENAGIYAVNGYDAVNILYELIQKHGNDVEKVKKALYNNEFKGAGGEIKFDENGDAIRKIELFEIKDNEYVKLNQ